MRNDDALRWNLEQLKKQAKELLKAANRGNADALSRFEKLDLSPSEADGEYQLSQAQWVIAREAGFASWNKLKARTDYEVESAFFAAIRAGDVRKVKRLGRDHSRILSQREHTTGMLAIQVAAFEGQRDVVELLLRVGANPTQGNPPSRMHSHALYYAESRGFNEVEGLIRRWLAKERRHTKTAQMLCRAIASQDNETVARMLAEEPKLVRATEFGNASGLPGGDPVLHFAIEHNNLESVQRLVDAGASLSERCIRGRTAIQRALAFLVGFGHRPGLDPELDYPARFQIARLLLERGATRDLWVECCLGNLPAVRALVAADPQSVNQTVNPTNASGGFAMDHYPLSGAAGAGNVEIAAFLLEQGADPNTPFRLTDWGHIDCGAPLELAVRNQNLPLVHLLLEHGANPNTSRHACSNAMQTAIASGNNQLIDLLLRKGGTIGFDGKFDFQWTNGQNILQQAAYLQMPGVCEPDVVGGFVATAAQEGNPALLELALSHLPSLPAEAMFPLLEKVIQMWRLYVAGHEDSDAKDYFECLRVLLARGVEANSTSLLGETCLHRLCRRQPYPCEAHRVEFAKILLKAGASVHLADELEGRTPLELARESGLNDLLAVLISDGSERKQAGGKD